MMIDKVDGFFVLLFVGTLLAIGYLCGVAMSERVPDTEDLLSEYQTLITGFLAVVAAAGTILTMLVVDYGQQKRHNQLMRISLRGDRLKALRARDPLAAFIGETIEKLRPYIGTIARVTPKYSENEIAEAERALDTIARTLEKIRDDEQFSQSSDLFGPQMSHNFRMLKVRIGDVLREHQEMHQRMAAFAVREPTIAKSAMRIAGEMDEVTGRLANFATDLMALAKQYE